MKIKRIRIRNILGIEDLEFRPGANGVLVDGANGTGKSSVIEAIKAVAMGGHDATLIRQGAEEGEVVWVFEDDVQVSKKVRLGGSTVDVRHPQMGKISAPQTYLKGLVDQLSINPVEFMVTSAAERSRILLEAMPLEVDAADLREAIGPVMQLGSPTKGVHALEAIAAAHKALYDERTGVNRVAKESRTTAEQLRASLPTNAPRPGQDEAAPLEEKKRLAERALAEELARIDVASARDIAEVKQRASEVIAALRDEIRSAERQAQEEEAKVLARAASLKGDLQVQEQPEINRMGSEIAAAKERMKAADSFEHVRQMLEAAMERAKANERRSEALSAALQRLDALRGRLLAELPIAGVTLQGGEVHRDGIPFPRLNTAAQVRLAVEVARLRAGNVPLVCMDGMECLDTPTFGLFVHELVASGLQAVVTRVTDGPLSVSPIGEVAEDEEVAHV